MYSIRHRVVQCRDNFIMDQLTPELRNMFAEQLFGAFVENGENGVFVVRADASIAYVNQAMGKLLAYDIDAFIGRPFLDFWATEFKALGEERYQARIAGAEPPKRYDIEMIRKDGLRLPVEVTAYRILFEGVAADAIVVRDISEHRRLEAELRNALKQSRDLSSVVETSFDAIVITDSEGLITYVNKSWQALNGWASEEVVGKVTPRVIKSGRQNSSFYRVFWQTIKAGSSARLDVTNRRKDGSEYFAELIVMPLKDDQGLITGFAGFQHDVTARHQVEQSLFEAKEFAEHIIDSANAMVVVLDNTGAIEVFNKRAEAITGYTKADLQGKNWFEVLAPRERYPDVWHVFEDYQKRGIVLQQFENPILTKDGRELMIAWTNSELNQGGQTVGTISFGMDITDRKKTEAQLLTINQELQRFKDLMVGRELKMIELKKEVELLRAGQSGHLHAQTDIASK